LPAVIVSGAHKLSGSNTNQCITDSVNDTLGVLLLKYKISCNSVTINFYSL
jgi:hypothetical protein